MRILVVEDELFLADILAKGLAEEGYAVDVAHDGEEGLFLAETEPSDLIILDRMLPGVDGMEILATIRRAGVQTPVLLLTARDTVADKIEGLDGGADDYLTKPFDFDELLARVRALIRRQTESRSAVIEIGDLVIDTASRSVSRGGRQVEFSAREYALLEYLAQHRNTVLSRTVLSEHLYDCNFDLDSNVIDVFISRLRAKIDRGHSTRLIHTVRGAGYILKG